MAIIELEALAEVIHEVWMEDKFSNGWAYAPVTNADAKRHSGLKPYDSLTEDEKECYRNPARYLLELLPE